MFGGNLYYVVWFFYVRYVIVVVVIERDYIIVGMRVFEGVNIEILLFSVELVDGIELLIVFNVEFIEKDGVLLYVVEFEMKLWCLRDWGFIDEEFVKLCCYVFIFVWSVLLNNFVKKLIEVVVFLVEECGVKKLNVVDVLFGNVFLVSSRIEDCLRFKVGLFMLL